MRILICTTQVPFTRGGAESHVEGLQRALIEAGHQAETVALPFKWYPPSEIMRSAMAWRMLDLSAANGQPVDLIIGMKFPAYVVAHPKSHVTKGTSYGAVIRIHQRPRHQAEEEAGRRQPLRRRELARLNGPASATDIEVAVRAHLVAGRGQYRGVAPAPRTLVAKLR